MIAVVRHAHAVELDGHDEVLDQLHVQQPVARANLHGAGVADAGDSDRAADHARQAVPRAVCA